MPAWNWEQGIESGNGRGLGTRGQGDIQHVRDGQAWHGAAVQLSCIWGPAANGVQLYNLGVLVTRRFCCNAISFDGLSALTQLTRLVTEYEGTAQRETLYSQLAQLTGLQHLSAPRALQSDGGKMLLPPTAHHQTLHVCSVCSLVITPWHVQLGALLACMATQGLLPCSKAHRRLFSWLVVRPPGPDRFCHRLTTCCACMCRHICADGAVQADAPCE